MNSISIIIKKSTSLLIVGVSVIVLSLPISIASNLPSVWAEMPEPVSDEYNKYIVFNEILVHFSYRLDYVYTIKNSTTSSWYTRNITAYENMTGNIDGTYQDGAEHYRGTIHDTNNIQGVVDVWGLTDLEEYDPVDADITLQTNSSGTITYEDAELALTGVNASYYSNFYNPFCYIRNDHTISIQLYRNLAMDNSLIVSGRVFLSFYYIPTGEMIYSTTDSFNSTAFSARYYDIDISNISSDYESNGNLQTLKVYGLELVNTQNIEFDLPQVLWDYPGNWDYYFLNTMLYVEEIWRNIVDVTSPVEPDTTAAWAEDLSSNTPHNDLNVTPTGQNVALKEALTNVNLSLSERSQLNQWADMFSNTKLIACCIFALACGSVILTLGKKKSE